MIEIKTISGKSYYYVTQTNRLYKSDKCITDDFSMGFRYLLSDRYSFECITMFTIEITQQCNLRCKYCCYSGEYENRRSHNSSAMSWKRLHDCVSFIGKVMDKDSSLITVCFYGGEALLSKNKIQWVIDELKDRYKDKEFEFVISTNGLLLNENTTEWICSIPNLKVTVTIDGNEYMHNNNRITSTGKGSFNRIVRNLDTLKKSHSKEYENRVQFISTVQTITDIIELNEFWMHNELLKNNRPKHISSIIPNFIKGEKVLSAKDKFDEFYRKSFEAYKKGEDNILTDELKHLIGVIKERKYYSLPHEQKFVTCMNDPYSCFISTNGLIYVCERMCEQHYIGNLSDGIDPDRCKQINNAYLSRKNSYCSTCWAKRLCRICATNLNNDIDGFLQYCDSERMQLQLALQYHCEVLEFEHNKSIYSGVDR